jgi:hypothetical protein
VKRKVSKKIPKVAKRKAKLVVPETIAILEQGEDLDNLYSVFGVIDQNDIDRILDGSVGVDSE